MALGVLGLVVGLVAGIGDGRSGGGGEPVRGQGVGFNAVVKERFVRVAFVLGTTSGGTGRHVRMLVEGLVRREHQVAVVGPGSVEASFDFRGAGARFAEVPVSDRPHPFNDLRAMLGIRRVARDADVVHAHGLRAGALAALALTLGGSPRGGTNGTEPSRREGSPSEPRQPLNETPGAPSGAGESPSGIGTRAGTGRAGESPSEAGTRAHTGGAEGSPSETGVRAGTDRAEGSPSEATRTGTDGAGGSPGETASRAGTHGGHPEGRRGRRARKVLVVTLHNALTAGGFVGMVYGVLERIVARRADRVLVVSPDLGERMKALGARDVEAAVVPAPALRSATRTPEEVRKELGAADRPLVLTVGRLAQQKGLDTLLEVAAGPWEAPEPLFAVAGEGPLREELQARIDERGLPVVLLGNRDDVPDLFAAAAVVVAASRWEGLPLNLSEALMAGRPVIASAVGGIPGLVGEGGLLVPYGDVEGFRGALRKVLGEPAYARDLAEAAARRGRELPDGDDAVAAVLSAYRSARSGG